jgi:CSLREA domain-containing protein
MAHLTLLTCREEFSLYAGPDGYYSQLLPGSSLLDCDSVAFIVRATGYQNAARIIRMGDLRGHPRQDFGLWPVADIVVDTTDDELNADGDCSLREAIQAANTDQAVDGCSAGSGADTISVPGGVYALALAGAGEDANATGDLDIVSDLRLIGAGVKGTVLDGKALDRVFHIRGGAAVQITGMTVTGGRTPDGASGPTGGDDAGPGGALANDGDLILSQCTFSGNRTGDGGDMTGLSYWGAPPGGDGGNGGAIYNAGAVQLYDSWVMDNTAGSGGTGGDADGIGRAGVGGGIYNIGKLTLEGAVVERNRGGMGGYLVSPPDTVGGPGGDGGGIYNAGDAAIARSTVADNRAGDGGSAGTHGVGGTGGRGGGIFNTGSLLLRRSTVSGNAGGTGGSAWTRGAGGDGGGIAGTAGSLWLVNSTVSGNRSGEGGTGFGTGPCAGGNGGGIFTSGGVNVENSTLAANHAGGEGGGVFIAERPIAMRNTILAGNKAAGEGPDCRAFADRPIPSLIELRGADLVGVTAGCVLIEAPGAEPSIIGRDPVLLPLGKYGGSTLTHALGIGSPAVDAGSCTDLRGDPVTEDQRGAARPQGKGCDIGAFEGVLPSLYLPLIQRGG